MTTILQAMQKNATAISAFGLLIRGVDRDSDKVGLRTTHNIRGKAELAG